MTIENTTGISDRIDIFLGQFDHTQIVSLSYIVSAAILLLLVLYIFLDGRRQKNRLQKLEQSNAIRANKIKS
ncbi:MULTISPECIES: heme exporter protein CcmD [Bartonella]|uniref:heme exporter protein CcmD n=1 Tax=Bartonella TaxID=773 RepID=UPI0018DD2709|nr:MULTISPECIES: heme exporter protein CcmD [Bartonella]MBH9974596.1 heme exporter protein CcmD [Bartonella choladocola]MBI0014203.1 heme exporter protein CcmD [Bartonella sp. B10834G3]